MKTVKVTWVDASTKSGWTDRQDVELTPALVRSVGWLVEETKDSISLASSFGRNGPGDFADYLTIPTSCVQSVETLFATPPERAQTPQDSSMDYGGGPFNSRGEEAPEPGETPQASPEPTAEMIEAGLRAFRPEVPYGRSNEANRVRKQIARIYKAMRNVYDRRPEQEQPLQDENLATEEGSKNAGADQAQAEGSPQTSPSIAGWTHTTGDILAYTQEPLDQESFAEAKGAAQPVCKYGDPLCPCPDGDQCHYEGKDAWPAPQAGPSVHSSESDGKAVQRPVGGKSSC